MPITLASPREEPLRFVGGLCFAALAAAVAPHSVPMAASFAATSASMLAKPDEKTGEILSGLIDGSPASRFGACLGLSALGCLAQHALPHLPTATIINGALLTAANHFTPLNEVMPQALAFREAIIPPSEPLISLKLSPGRF